LGAKILGAADNPDQVFPEEQLEARLATGQLDAGVFYRNEVEERGVPYIALPKEINLGDSIVYSISVLEDAPNRAGAIAFVNFFLSEAGRRILRKHGLAPVQWSFTGEPPAGVKPAP
jgi:molybdate/tungstate transport system substrate-binding protein